MSNYLEQAASAERIFYRMNLATETVAKRIGAKVTRIDDELSIDLPEGWTWEAFTEEVEKEIEADPIAAGKRTKKGA